MEVTPLEALNFSSRTYRCLRVGPYRSYDRVVPEFATVQYLDDYVEEHGPKSLLKIRNFGRKCMDEVVQKLEAFRRNGIEKKQKNMSLRDWYAGLAMQGLIFEAGKPNPASYVNMSPDTLSEDAFKIADAMIVGSKAEKEQECLI